MPALDTISYMSALSGGNLATVPYHYAQNVDSNELLDAEGMSHPSEITMEELTTTPPKSLFRAFTSAALPALILGMFEAYFFEGALWPKIMYHKMLAPFGIAQNTLMTDAIIRSEVKSTPIVETSMLSKYRYLICHFHTCLLNIQMIVHRLEYIYILLCRRVVKVFYYYFKKYT